MAIAITPVPGTFEFREVAANNGAIANSLTFKITDGTFAGDNGDSLLLSGAVVTGAPVGLTPVLVKTSATTAKLTFKGAADAHANAQDVSNLTVTFANGNFATGGTAPAAITNLKIDFTDPAAPGTLSLEAPTGADTGALYSKAALDAGTLKITGTATTPTGKVYIYNNGKLIKGAEATAVDGKWSFDLKGLSVNDKYKDGVYNLTASETADGKGAMTAGFAFTVDTKAPSAPSVNAIKGATSDTTPVLSGRAEKGASVQVFADGVLLGTTMADAKGAWTLAVTNTVLADGGDRIYLITAQATDAAGNTSTSKKAVALTIDTTVAEPTLVAATPNKGSVVLSGSGEVGAAVQLYAGTDGALAMGKPIKIGKTGTWKTTLKLPEGEHLLSATVTDAAGNVSGHSAEVPLTIDLSTPKPTLALVKGEDGVLTGFRGTAEAGAVVTISVGSAVTSLKSAPANAQGEWEISDISGFVPPKFDTALSFKAIAKDASGNVSQPSDAVTHTFPATGPLIAGTEAADTLTGTGAGDPMEGRGGDDTLNGGAGNDTLIGGAGADSLNGEAGTDTVSYRDVTDATAHGLSGVAGVAVNLSAAEITAETVAEAMGGGIVLGGGAGAAGAALAANTAGYLAASAAVSTEAMVRDTLASIENAEGSALNDYLVGGATANKLEGGDGNDLILGNGGNDVLDGGAGNDTLVGGAGADRLTGGTGDDTFDLTGADSATDTITDWGNGADTFKAGSVLAAGVQLNVTLFDGSAIAFTAADIAATTGVVSVTGGTGNDSITGGANNDTLGGGAGADTLHGGTGDDQIGGGEGDDNLSGDAGNDSLSGDAGNDSLSGGNGNDTLTGGTGDDTLTGGAGADTFTITTTAADTDTITDWGLDGHADVLAGVAFAGQTLKVSIADNSITPFSAAAAFAIHGVVSVTGGEAVDHITGGGGNDTLSGGGGGDSIYGGAGADVIIGGDGLDQLTGGAGSDTFVFADNAVNNGNDTVTDFVFGAAGDKLNFDAFLTADAAFYEVAGTGTTISGDGVAAGSPGATPIALADMHNKVVLVTTTDIGTQAVTEAALFKADGVFAAEGTPTEAIHSVLLVGEDAGSDGVQVYYVTDGSAANDMTITLVATLSGVNLANVHANNLF